METNRNEKNEGNWVYSVLCRWFMYLRGWGTVRYYETRRHLSVRQSEEELPVEASGPSQRRVDGVQAVCRSDHHDLTPAVQPVHQSQERRHDGAAGRDGSRNSSKRSISACKRMNIWVGLLWPVYLVLPTGSDRSQTVNLIKEDDGGTPVICLRTTHTNTHSTAAL